MERQERKNGSSRLIRYSAAPLLVLALASCQDLSLFIDHLDDEVKLANDRYLEVVETYPEQNDQEVNPSVPLLITFDRPVNPDLVENWLDITVQNSIGESDNFVKDLGGSLTYSIDETGTLTVNTSPFLTGGAKVILSLTAGLPAKDGSILRDTRSWSFFTGRLPAGELKLHDGKNGADPGYSNGTGITAITAEYLAMDAELYKVSMNRTDLDTGNTADWLSVVNGTAQPLPKLPGPPYSYNLYSAPDGPKSLYIRFKDNDRNFSPIIDASTILDTLAPSIKPYFKGSGTTNKSVIVIAGAEDANGIKTYTWSDPAVEKSLVFGTPSSDSTTVYPETQPSIEKQYTIHVWAEDKAGNPGSSTIKLNWDKFVAAPTVEFDSKHFLTEDIIDFSRDPDPIAPEVHLVYDDRPWSLPFGWYLGEKDVPNEDLSYFLIGVNDFLVEKKFYDFSFDNDVSKWSSKDIPIFEYYPDVEALMPGYYQIKFLVSDKLENISDEGTEYISYVSPRFRDIINSGKDAWPNRVSNVNRFPSFAWPPDPEGNVKREPDIYYYKLYVGDQKNPVEIINDVPQKPYWYHTGPTDLPALSPGEKIYWWYEVWNSKDDKSVFQSFKEFDYFEFKTGEF